MYTHIIYSDYYTPIPRGTSSRQPARSAGTSPADPVRFHAARLLARSATHRTMRIDTPIPALPDLLAGPPFSWVAP